MIPTLPHHVRSLFELMKFAEVEIAEARAREPDPTKQVAIHGAFAFLCPPPGMTSLDERVYRAHAKELIARCASGARLDDGTKAEVMVTLSQMSLVAPPNAQHAALYERLFVEVMGEALPGEAVREPWPGASDELLARLRRKAGRERSGRDLGEKRSTPNSVKKAKPRRPTK